MIDDKTKYKLLKELEKSGNVYLSCLKVGIDRSTHYRWFDYDKEFRKLASQAIRRGKENNCDIAKHALMIKVKEKDMRAIEYVLSHNDPTYKRKQTSNVVIVHKKDIPIPNIHEKTFEEIFEDDDRDIHERGLELQKNLTMFGGKIPPKPNGSPIEVDELPGYEAYIRDWQKQKTRERNMERLAKGLPIPVTPYCIEDSKPNIADPKPKTETPTPAAPPQEKQTPQKEKQTPPKDIKSNSPIEYRFKNITDIDDD